MRSSDQEGHKEVYVKVIPLSPNETHEFNISKLKCEYDREEKELKHWNIFSGGGIGASIGLVACLTSSIFGVPATSAEVLVIVGSSLFLGIIAGFILY